MIQIKNSLCARAAAQKVPISGAFELTPRCNFHCKMCYVRQTPEQMALVGRERSKHEWVELARQARQEGLIFLLLTGGEPMLRPDFGEIYEELTQLGLSITINTNGSLLSDELRALFRRLPPAMVNVTLYAATAEGYQRLCGVPGGLERALQTIRFFREIGTFVNINTTITPWNVGQYEGICTLGKKLGLKIRATLYNFPPTRGGSCDSFRRLSPQEVGRLLARDVQQWGGPEQVSRIAQGLKTGDEIPMGCSMEPGEGMHCYAGKSQFWITWDGKMTPCGMLPGPAAQPFEVGFRQAWSQTVSAAEQISLCPDCRDCEMKGTCTNCAAVTWAESGAFDGRPEYMCQVNQSFRQSIRKLCDDK